MDFYKVEIDAELFNKAKARATSLPGYRANFKKHLQDQDGELQAKIEGSIGELIFEKWLNDNSIAYMDARKNYSYDYFLGGTASRIEVKTKLRTVEPPKPHYECSVSNYILETQSAGIYAFVSLTHNDTLELSADKYTNGYFVGVMSGKKFKKTSRHFEEGDIDPLNNYIVKETCSNVFISQLGSPSQLQDYVMSKT